MTYQITMSGCDGILMASDRREISLYKTAKVALKNDVIKIRISPDGRFAWAYSGNEIAPIYSRHIGQVFEGRKVVSDEDVKEILSECGRSAAEEWRGSASGPIGSLQPVIVMASGATGKIFRSVARPTTEPEEMKRGLCISGQTANWAAFFPERYYSGKMPIDELSWLATLSLRISHDFDSLYVDRFDIAIYRDSSGGFELINGDPYWEEATKFSERIDVSIRQLLQEQAKSRGIG